MIFRASTLVFLYKLSLQKRLNPAPIMSSDLASLDVSLSSSWDINSARFVMNLGPSCYTREQHKMTAAIGCLVWAYILQPGDKVGWAKSLPEKKTQNTSVLEPKNGGFHVHRRSGQKVSKLRLKSGLLLCLRSTHTSTSTNTTTNASAASVCHFREEYLREDCTEKPIENCCTACP